MKSRTVVFGCARNNNQIFFKPYTFPRENTYIPPFFFFFSTKQLLPWFLVEKKKKEKKRGMIIPECNGKNEGGG